MTDKNKRPLELEEVLLHPLSFFAFFAFFVVIATVIKYFTN